MDDCVKGLEPEQQIAQAVTTYRSAAGMTVEQLAEVVGLAPADIIHLEDGTANPTLSTLKQLAAGMGMQLRLEFVPMAHPKQ